MLFRVYACGNIIQEDEFKEADEALPYYDEYYIVSVPDIVVEHIINKAEGK